MKETNFNQLKSVKTPDSWIEKAVNIPKTNKKPIPFFIKPYFIGSVACLVICCVLSLLVFFNFNNSAPVPVAPVDKTSDSQNDTSANVSDSTLPTENPNSNQISDSTYLGFISPFTSYTNPINNNSNSIVSGETTPSTSKNSSTSPSSATQSNNPTPGATSSNSSTTKPVATEPTESPQVTEPNTKPPIVNPTEYPTISGGPTKNPQAPVENYFYGGISFNAKENSVFSQYDNLYCHIVSINGASYSSKFSSAEKATKTMTGNSFIANYVPTLKNINLLYGEYYVIFYDEHGHSLTYTCYLGSKNINIYE